MGTESRGGFILRHGHGSAPEKRLENAENRVELPVPERDRGRVRD